jgi:hypothetical protein
MNRIIAKLLSKPELLNTNGHSHSDGQRAQRRSSYVTTRAELAPCTCPDSCERDHEND